MATTLMSCNDVLEEMRRMVSVNDRFNKMLRRDVLERVRRAKHALKEGLTASQQQALSEWASPPSPRALVLYNAPPPKSAPPGVEHLFEGMQGFRPLAKAGQRGVWDRKRDGESTPIVVTQDEGRSGTVMVTPVGAPWSAAKRVPSLEVALLPERQEMAATADSEAAEVEWGGCPRELR